MACQLHHQRRSDCAASLALVSRLRLLLLLLLLLLVLLLPSPPPQMRLRTLQSHRRLWMHARFFFQLPLLLQPSTLVRFVFFLFLPFLLFVVAMLLLPLLL